MCNNDLWSKLHEKEDTSKRLYQVCKEDSQPVGLCVYQGHFSMLHLVCLLRFHGSILGLYRYTIGIHHGNKNDSRNITDSDLLYEYNITSPETMIRVARLALWSRILCKAPDVLASLCHDMANIWGWMA